MKILAGFVVLLSFASGVSLVLADDDVNDRYLTDANDCMFFRSIYNWKVIDDRNLIVWSPSRSQPYVVTLSFPLHSLRFRDALAFEDGNHDGRLCGFGMDGIIVGGSFAQRSSIRGIKKLDGTEVGPLEGLYELYSKRPKDDADENVESIDNPEHDATENGALDAKS
jgi:hypothetical protein